MSHGTVAFVTHDPSVGVCPFGFAPGRRGHLPSESGEA